METIKQIQLVITGGTIDSDWAPAKDTAVPLVKSGIKDYIQKFIKPNFAISEHIVCMRDSRNIDDDIRQQILKVLKDSSDENILITHGTYTMAETGRFLKSKFESDSTLQSKRIILVGSFWPLVFSPSDAPFNIGFAVGSFQSIKPGVYIAMNAQLFDPCNVTKHLENAEFITE